MGENKVMFIKHAYYFLLFLLMVNHCIYSQPPVWSNLEQGKYSCGFKTLRIIGSNQNPLLVSLWYPAEKGNQRISLAGLITAGRVTEDIADTTLIREFKNVVMRIYDMESVPEPLFSRAISATINTYHNAAMIKGRFPLIIASSQPASYFASFEYFASHGYVVASVQARFSTPPDTTDPMHRYTDALNELLDYMYDKPYIDNTNITAFGHGGGIQSAMFLSMRTRKIKRVINLDGGFFGPRSETTRSKDYRPEQFTDPMLHIITVSQQKEDDPMQFRAIRSPLTRVRIKSDSIQHHDFTVIGKVAGIGLGIRSPMELIDGVFKAVNEIMLRFLSGQQIEIISNHLFQIEKFNQ